MKEELGSRHGIDMNEFKKRYEKLGDRETRREAAK